MIVTFICPVYIPAFIFFLWKKENQDNFLASWLAVTVTMVVLYFLDALDRPPNPPEEVFLFPAMTFFSLVADIIFYSIYNTIFSAIKYKNDIKNYKELVANRIQEYQKLKK